MTAVPAETRIVADRGVDGFHGTFVSYVQALAGFSRVPVSSVRMEHSYARGGGGASAAYPEGTRLLLVRRAPRCPDCHVQISREEEIDVETADKEPIPPLMLSELPYWEKGLAECDMIGEDEDLKPDWEEKLYSLAWNTPQSTLLKEALEIIHSCRAALLTSGVAGAKRAAARGGGARSLRALLAAPQTRWQPCLAQWLHNALTEHLPTPLLVCYREIMLTMKSKVPILVDKMTAFNPLTGRIQGAENGASGPTIASGNNAPSDPSAPILLLVPSGRDKRDARWAERLRAVAQVHIVHSHQTSWPPNLPIPTCLSQLVNTARSRAESLKIDNPRRPLVLVGQGPGAGIAIQLAVSVPGIAGVVCLGLPLLTANGPRGTPDDTILDLICPVLFVIGQNASNCTQQDAENLRCKLQVKSRLVVAGGADELLRLPRLKRQLEGITQRMLECSIADEVASFLSFILNDDGDHCSSPESYGRPDREKDMGTNSLHSIRSDPIFISNRRRPSSPKGIKKKRPRNRLPLKSPIKSRGTALYEVNNPPPEGAIISIGDIHNTKVIIEDDDDLMMGTKIGSSPPSKPRDRNSYIQIHNDRVRIPITGNGAYNSSKKTGIKVLENIPYKGGNLAGNILKNAISRGSLPLKTQIICRKPQGTRQTVQESQITSSSSPPNIMDLPIVFADDNKAMDNESKQTNQQATGGVPYKAIVINKHQMITQSPQSKNIVQMKLSNSSPSGGAANSTNPIKYTKVILTKKSQLDGTNVIINADGSKGQITSKPIIVKSKGQSISAFKVLHGNIFQNNPGNVFQNKQQRLIIKRAVVPSGLNLNSADAKKFQDNPKVDGESLRENAKKDSTIEAAVASITGQDYMKNMLENFD